MPNILQNMKMHFSILNFKNPLKTAMDLADNDPTIQKYFSNDKFIQQGGKTKPKIEEIEHNSFKYKFYVSKLDQNTITYKLHPENNPNTNMYDCIFLLVDIEEKIVNLRGINYNEKCFEKETIKNIKQVAVCY